MTDDLISRQAAIDILKKWSDGYSYIEVETNSAIKAFEEIPSAQSEQLSKINDLVEGTIDHFDKDDAMDLLYAIKGVLKNG